MSESPSAKTTSAGSRSVAYEGSISTLSRSRMPPAEIKGLAPVNRRGPRRCESAKITTVTGRIVRPLSSAL